MAPCNGFTVCLRICDTHYRCRVKVSLRLQISVPYYRSRVRVSRNRLISAVRCNDAPPGEGDAAPKAPCNGSAKRLQIYDTHYRCRVRVSLRLQISIPHYRDRVRVSRNRLVGAVRCQCCATR